MANSHKRDADARRKSRAALVAGPLALLATGTAVTVGVLVQDPASTDTLVSQGATTDISRVVREPVVSRSDSRLASVRGERVILQMQDAYDARKTRQAIENAHVHRVDHRSAQPVDHAGPGREAGRPARLGQEGPDHRAPRRRALRGSSSTASPAG